MNKKLSPTELVLVRLDENLAIKRELRDRIKEGFSIVHAKIDRIEIRNVSVQA